MTTITGNARFRESVAARLVLAMRPDQSIADTAVPDAQSSPVPGDYSIQVDTHQVLLQAHAFDPAKLVGPWRAETVFAVGDVIFETGIDADALLLECTAVTGTEETGAAEPTWDTTLGNTTTDNDVTWETLGTISELTPITQFLYQPVLLSAVSPESGSVDGDTTITITGSGFAAGGSVSVLVNGNAATNVTVVSDTEITGETPAGTEGSADVVVTIGGESVTLAGAFDYEAEADYESTVLSDSPIAYWRLDEAINTTAEDISGNNHDGSYTGSPSIDQPPLIQDGRSVNVSGGSRVTTPFDFDPGGPFSFEIWFKADNLNSSRRMLISDRQGIGGSWAKQIRIDGDRLQFWVAGSSEVNVDDTDTISTGETHHVVGTWDGTTMRIYVDGQEKATASQSSIDSSAGSMVLGAADDGSIAFDGSIDEAAIYDKALSAPRVKAHYDAGTQ